MHHASPGFSSLRVVVVEKLKLEAVGHGPGATIVSAVSPRRDKVHYLVSVWGIMIFCSWLRGAAASGTRT